jgi:hypothetical protein
MTPLHPRAMEEKGGHNFNVVNEILDVKNRELADVAKVDDFIVSDRLISPLLTEISENKRLNLGFKELFDAGGSEIYVKPERDGVETGKSINFYTVVESARRRNEIAIGYKIAGKSHSAKDSYGVAVNPVKYGKVAFSDDDKIIVIAED